MSTVTERRRVRRDVDDGGVETEGGSRDSPERASPSRDRARGPVLGRSDGSTTLASAHLRTRIAKREFLFFFKSLLIIGCVYHLILCYQIH